MFDKLDISLTKEHGNCLCRSSKSKKHYIPKGTEALAIKFRISKYPKMFYFLKHCDEVFDKIDKVKEEILIRKLAGVL